MRSDEEQTQTHPDDRLQKAILPPAYERLLAILAHLSAFLPFMGWVVALTFWFASRGQARYTAFQAKQACVFQLILGIFSFFSGVSSFILLNFLMGPRGPRPMLLELFPEYAWAFWPLFVLQIFKLTYALAGAIFCAWGLPFRYRFVALWLRQE